MKRAKVRVGPIHVFVDNAAVRQAIVLDLVPNHFRGAQRKIAEMAVNSAPFTHGRVNRRYDDVGLMVQDNTVTRVIKLGVVTKGRSTSCLSCGGTGKVKVPQIEKGDPSFVRCPDCSPPQK